jgi:hypothetical protein
MNIGFGFVRGVDTEKRLFYVVTPVPPEEMEFVNCLTLGALTLPTGIIGSQAAQLMQSSNRKVLYLKHLDWYANIFRYNTLSRILIINRVIHIIIAYIFFRFQRKKLRKRLIGQRKKIRVQEIIFHIL